MATAGEPDPRELIAQLDATQRKVVGAVVVAMIKHHDRVRDQEWLAAQLVSAVTLAMENELAEVDDPARGVTLVEDYAHQHRDRIFSTALALFVHVAQTMQQRPSFAFDDAVACAMDCLGAQRPPSGGPPSPV